VGVDLCKLCVSHLFLVSDHPSSTPFLSSASVRIQSLFAFMQNSNRSHAVIGDIFEKIPDSFLLATSLDGSNPGTIVSGKFPSSISLLFFSSSHSDRSSPFPPQPVLSIDYLDNILLAFKTTLAESTGRIGEGQRVSRGSKNTWAAAMLGSVFSHGEAAAPSGLLVSGRKTPPIPTDVNTVFRIQLQPKKWCADVPSALHEYFMSGEVPKLLTVPAQVLCMEVKSGVLPRNPGSNKSNTNPQEAVDPTWMPITLQPRIMLDRYLWQRHDGLSMEWGFRKPKAEIKALENRRADLERYRVSMLLHEVSFDWSQTSFISLLTIVILLIRTGQGCVGAPTDFHQILRECRVH